MLAQSEDHPSTRIPIQGRSPVPRTPLESGANANQIRENTKELRRDIEVVLNMENGVAGTRYNCILKLKWSSRSTLF
jgi:hypothetical protein